MPLSHELKGSETLKWRHNFATIFHRTGSNKLAAGNKDDISENGSLILKNLAENSAGKYTPEVFDKEGKAITNLQATQLCVLGR